MSQDQLVGNKFISPAFKIPDNYNNNLPWYHGSISKDATEQFLQSQENGVFLVRDSISYPGDFTLCVKFNETITGYRIKCYHYSKLTIDDEELFDSLEELVDAYRKRRKELIVHLTRYIIKESEPTPLKSKAVTITKTSVCEYGRIFMGTYMNRKILLKAIQHVEEMENLLKKSVCHENLINIIGLTKINKVCYLVTSYAEYGILIDLLRTWARTTYVRSFAYNFAYDICSGMEYLEKKYVFHKYLSARNIWISKNGVAKLANFGLSEDFAEDSKNLPYRHWAPEVLIAQRHSSSADIWSFGITLWEIFTNGSVPYVDYPYYRILKFLRTGQRLPRPRGCPNHVYEIMKQCWKWKVGERPTFEDMKAKFQELRIELYHPCFVFQL